MAIEGIRKVTFASVGHQEISFSSSILIPVPQSQTSCEKAIQASHAFNIALGGDRGNAFFIAGLNGEEMVTVPFDWTVCPELENAIREQSYYVAPELAKVRHAQLTEGFFVTDDAKNGGFLLCLPGGVRHFGAYQIPSIDGFPMRFCSNSCVIGRPNVEGLYEESLRRPELLVSVSI